MITRRENSGASYQLLKELAAEDPTEYRYALKMNEDLFNDLLNLVAPSIQKSDTFMQCAISAKVKIHSLVHVSKWE